MENWTLNWTKLIELKKESVEALEDSLPGVYRFSYKADDGSYYVFYVGQADDIKKHLLDHLSNNEKNVCIRNYLSTKSCSFKYARITNIDVRKAAERQIYKTYEPSCNNMEPEGRDDIKVNLT